MSTEVRPQRDDDRPVPNADTADLDRMEELRDERYSSLETVLSEVKRDVLSINSKLQLPEPQHQQPMSLESPSQDECREFRDESLSDSDSLDGETSDGRAFFSPLKGRANARSAAAVQPPLWSQPRQPPDGASSIEDLMTSVKSDFTALARILDTEGDARKAHHQQSGRGSADDLHLCDILIANVFITQGGADWRNGSQETAARQAFKMLMRDCHVVGSSRRWLGTDYLVLCLSEKNTLIPDLPPYLSDPNEPMWMKNKPPANRKDAADIKRPDGFVMDEERFESRNVKPLRELWLLTEGAPDTPQQIMNPVRFLYNSGRFSNMLISFEFEVLSNGLFNCTLFVDRHCAGYGYGNTIDMARGFAARNATNDLFHRHMRVGVDVSGNREPLDPSVLWDKEVDPTHYLLYLKMQRLQEFREKTMKQDFTQLLTHYIKNTPDFLEPLKFHQRDFEAKWPMFIECACELGLFYRIVGNTDKFRQLLICKRLPLMQLREVLMTDGRCGRYWVVSKGADESGGDPAISADQSRAEALKASEPADEAGDSAKAAAAATKSPVVQEVRDSAGAAAPAGEKAPQGGQSKPEAAGLKSRAPQSLLQTSARLSPSDRPLHQRLEPPRPLMQNAGRLPQSLMQSHMMLPLPIAAAPALSQPAAAQSRFGQPLLGGLQRLAARPGPVPFSRFAAAAAIGSNGGGIGGRPSFVTGPPKPLFPFMPRRP